MSESPVSESRVGESPASDGTAPNAPVTVPRTKRVSWRLWVRVVAVVLVIFLAAWASLPFWRPSAPALVQRLTASLVAIPAADDPTVLRQEVDALTNALSAIKTAQHEADSRIAKLEEATAPDLTDVTARVDALEKQASSLALVAPAKPQATTTAVVTPAPEQVKALALQVDGLSQRLKDLSAGTAQATAVLALGDRVATVEKAVQTIIARQDRAVAFLLTVGQLREAVQAGGVFADQLKAARAIAPSDVSVDALTADFSPWSDRGIPQVAALAVHFASLAPAIIRASVVTDLSKSSDFWQQTLSRLSSVLTITRSDGGGAGGDTAATVARVQALLQAGDLAAAVSEAKQLDAAATAVAKPWFEEAKAHLAATKGLATLTSEAVARIGVSASGGLVSPASAAPEATGGTPATKVGG